MLGTSRRPKAADSRVEFGRGKKAKEKTSQEP